jgi:drug/metabolite transporter (DMT)-like permease
VAASDDSGGRPAAGRDGDPGAAVFLLLMVLIGSSTATAAKFAVRELPVALLPLLRFGIAAACLLPLLLRGRALPRMVRDDGRRLALAGLLCVPINQTFFLNGTRLAPTTHVALIYATCPLIVLLLAVALGQERMTRPRLVGVLTTVAGAGVLAWGQLAHRAGGASGAAVLRGDALLVGAVASWAAYLTVNKPLVARHGSLPVLAGTFLIGSLLDLPLALNSLRHPEALWTASRVAWLGLLHLALVVTVCGLACQNQALRRLDASQVATVGNAAPLLTVVWGVWLLGEALSPSLVAGGALILGGIVWANGAASRAARRAVAVAPPVAVGPAPAARHVA